MSEMKVQKQSSQARPETGLATTNDFFRPMLPMGRLFGLSPFAMMREFTEEMDRAFRGAGTSLEAWAPTIDVQRCNGTFVVTAELPGLQKDEIKVEMLDDALVIQGERKREHKEDHEGYHRYERSYGQFYRSIPLPEGVKADQVKAELNEGVLKVSMPVAETKKPEEKGTRIPIESGAKKSAAA